MTKGERRQQNFRTAMLRDLYSLLEQGIINQHSFSVAVNSLDYVVVNTRAV